MQAIHLFHNNRHLPLRTIFLFCFPLFFILLADSVMSYMFPILVERTTNSTAILGVIMALSSVLGIICDFTFPQLIRGRSWKFQITTGIIISLLFPLFAHLGSAYTIVYFLVVATLVWGVYFEFLQFSQQSFIVSEDKPGEYSKDWGIIFFVYQITINIAPILGSILLKQYFFTASLTVQSFQIISLLFMIMVMFMLPNKRSSVSESQIKKTISLFQELRYWKELGVRIWPAIINGVLISSINATFWTLGGLLGIQMAGDGGVDWLVMVLFGLSGMIGAIVLTKISIHKHKKMFSQFSILVGGICLMVLYGVRNEPLFVYVIIALASFSFSFAGPLNEAVYSDLLERSGKSRLYLLGIAKSNTSLAYIIAPLFTGFLADKTSYLFTFSVVGSIAVVLSIILLLTTPKKIHLPQQIIQKMK